LFRDHDIGAPVLEIVDGHFHDALGIFHGVMLIEFDVDHILLLHAGNGVGGDQFGVETVGHVGDILKDALDIDHHGIAGAGDNGQFLLQKGAAQRAPRGAADFVGGAADPGQLDTFGPLDLAYVTISGCLGHGHNHFGQNRFMAMNDQVDVVRFHHAEVGFGLQG
jgi:hypothetical protein